MSAHALLRRKYLVVHKLDGEVLEVREREQVRGRLHGVAHHAQLEHERHLVLHVPPHLARRPRRRRRLAANDYITITVVQGNFNSTYTRMKLNIEPSAEQEISAIVAR